MMEALSSTEMSNSTTATRCNILRRTNAVSIGYPFLLQCFFPHASDPSHLEGVPENTIEMALEVYCVSNLEGIQANDYTQHARDCCSAMALHQLPRGLTRHLEMVRTVSVNKNTLADSSRRYNQTRQMGQNMGHWMDRLCGLVVTVPGCKPIAPGLDSRR
jgi:hypothetical protein